MPKVISVDPGPPLDLDIRMLPGQSPQNFSAHAAAIADDLSMTDVRVVPLGPSDIRLELLPTIGIPDNHQPGAGPRNGCKCRGLSRCQERVSLGTAVSGTTA